MTHNAILHALKSISVPSGRALWLYGDPAIAAGDIYSPWHQDHLPPTATRQFHAETATLAPSYPAVFLNCPKQHDESEGLLALALQRSNGFVLAAAPKNAGGGRLIAMMESYGIPFDTLSKDSCRVVWTFAAPAANRTIITRNIANLAPRQITMDNESWWSTAGIFGWDKIDSGSHLLLQHLPPDISGHVADFGCGYGYLSRHLIERYPHITALDAYDADARAIAVIKQNCTEKVHPLWLDIRTLPARARYDAVIMNPPFHSGKREDIALGESFIRNAWDNLKQSGRLFFVANRHLPYEKIIPNLIRLYEGDGFKIITGQKP